MSKTKKNVLKWLAYTTAMSFLFVFFLIALGIEAEPWRVGTAFALLTAMMEIHNARQIALGEKE